MYSKRINEIYSLIDKMNKGIYDVGSDHGYLLLLLRENGFVGKLKGVENKIGPFNNLKNNTIGFNIDIELSDGLDNLNNDYSCIVLAGMGFKNIDQIIMKNIDRLNYINQVVVDSHNSIDEVRKLFVSLSFIIDDEKIIEEDGIFYEIISFKRLNKKNCYNELDFKYGPILRKERTDTFIKKYAFEIQKIKNILLSIGKDDKVYYKLSQKCKELEDLICNKED